MGTPDHHTAFVRLRSKTTGDWFAHPELRDRLVADAHDQGSNLTDIAVKILCDRFKVPFEPSGRKTTPQSEYSPIIMRLPHRLYRALSATYGAKYQDGIRQLLCAHYGLGVPVKVKRPRVRRSSQAAAA